MVLGAMDVQVFPVLPELHWEILFRSSNHNQFIQVSREKQGLPSAGSQILECQTI